MIKIELATEQPIENEELWSYPVSEIGYLLEKGGSATYLFYKDRLYEVEE